MRGFLTTKLPQSVTVGRVVYPIATDFREILKINEVLSADKGEDEKACEALFLFYGQVPMEVEEAVKCLLHFFLCGKEEKAERSDNKGADKAVNYSFVHDGEMIYSAFLAQYAIDLTTVEYLHWWKFVALFAGLNKEHLLSEVIRCRGIDTKGEEYKGNRAYYDHMRKAYALPLAEGLEEHLSALELALMGDGDLQGVLGKQE